MFEKYFTTLLLCLAIGSAQAQFVTIWKTDNDGTSDDQSITIPAVGTDYSVEWEQVGNPAVNGATNGTDEHTITFPAVGTYKVSISPGAGNFDGLAFRDEGDPQKLLEITQWGTIEWQSLAYAFEGCSNLTIAAVDIPDLRRITSTSNMFTGCTSLTTIPRLNEWDVSGVTDASAMFLYAARFNDAIDDWDVSQVGNMNYMFNGAAAFNQPIGSWTVSGATHMSEMFGEANAFNQPLNDWDVSNVSYMDRMFWNAGAFNQPLGAWNLSGVADMTDMLSGSAIDCDNLSATLTGWAENPLTAHDVNFDATGRQYDEGAAAAVAELSDAKGWTISTSGLCVEPAPFVTIWKTNNPGTSSNVRITIPVIGTNYHIEWEQVGNPAVNGTATGTGTHTITFPAAGNYQVRISKGDGNFDGLAFHNGGDRRKLLEITNWGTTEWKNLDYAFEGCSNLTITAIDVPDLSQVTSFSNMFARCASLSTIPRLNEWDVSSVTDASAMFNDAVTFNGAVGEWDVSQVENMDQMFKGAAAFNQPIDDWNVGSTTSMSEMFDSAVTFNQPLNDWDVSQVINMAYMFYEARAFNQPLDDWNVSGVTNMTGMFSGARVFNRPIGNWDVSSVTDMYQMFALTAAFNEPLNDWDVSSVENTGQMFFGSAYNQPLDKWEVGQVTDMEQMFHSNVVFNQPLNDWDVSQVEDMAGMFFGAKAFDLPLNSWDVRKVKKMPGMFYSASAFNQSLANWTLSSVTEMSIMLAGAAIDCANLSATLVGWANNPLTANSVRFGAGNRSYGDHATGALTTLRTTKSWTVTIGSAVECTPLAVRLVDFTVKDVEGSVALAWSTAGESDHDYFEVQRSADTREWAAVVRVKGAGTTNSLQTYKESDLQPLRGTSYYRLKIVDIEGLVEYSDIRSVRITTVNRALGVYPNPAASTITLTGFSNGILSVYNALGHEVRTKEVSTENVVINVADLPAGLYVIRAANGKHTRFVKH